MARRRRSSEESDTGRLPEVAIAVFEVSSEHMNGSELTAVAVLVFVPALGQVDVGESAIDRARKRGDFAVKYGGDCGKRTGMGLLECSEPHGLQ
jgi:hypothetical protein